MSRRPVLRSRSQYPTLGAAHAVALSLAGSWRDSETLVESAFKPGHLAIEMGVTTGQAKGVLVELGRLSLVKRGPQGRWVLTERGRMLLDENKPE